MQDRPSDYNILLEHDFFLGGGEKEILVDKRDMYRVLNFIHDIVFSPADNYRYDNLNFALFCKNINYRFIGRCILLCLNDFFHILLDNTKVDKSIYLNLTHEARKNFYSKLDISSLNIASDNDTATLLMFFFPDEDESIFISDAYTIWERSGSVWKSVVLYIYKAMRDMYNNNFLSSYPSYNHVLLSVSLVCDKSVVDRRLDSEVSKFRVFLRNSSDLTENIASYMSWYKLKPSGVVSSPYCVLAQKQVWSLNGAGNDKDGEENEFGFDFDFL